MRPLVAALAVALAAVAALVAPVDDARACSCVRPDPERDLPRADAAFVGVLDERREADASAFHTFDVERVAKGELGEEVVVRTHVSGASCGLEVAEGARIGLLLEAEGRGWTSNLCKQVDPKALLAAAPGAGPPLPGAPDAGHGVHWGLVAGALGAAALLTLAVTWWSRRSERGSPPPAG